MILTRIKLIASIVLLSALFALALPEFSINIGETKLTYPSIGFGKIGIGADFGSFRKGKDIYAQQVFTGEVQFPEGVEITNDEKTSAVKDIVAKIQRRLTYAALFDIDVEGQVTDDIYKIALHVPQYYEEQDEYAKWLFLQGNITFNYLLDPNDESSRIEFSVSDKDIISIVKSNNIRYTQPVTDDEGNVIDTTESVAGGLNLRLLLDQSKVDYVRKLPDFIAYANTIFAGQQYGAVMRLDNQPLFEIVRDDTNDRVIRALPTGIDSVKTRSDVLSITQAFFREDSPLEYSIALSQISSAEAPALNPDGSGTIAVSFVMGMALALLYTIRLIGFRKTVLVGEMLSFAILSTIIILKFVQSPISSGFIFGFIAMILLYLYVLIDIVSAEDKQQMYQKVRDYMVLVFLTLVAMIMVYLFRKNTEVFSQSIEVIVAATIGFAFTLNFHVRFITETFIFNSIDIRTLFGIRKKYEK
jgi:hypothetical protein